MKVKNKNLKKMNVFMIISFVVLLVYTISLLFPFLWALLTSLKSNMDYQLNMFGLPKEWRFSNYGVVFRWFFVTTDKRGTVYIEGLLLNSLLTAFGQAFFLAFFNCVAGYCCAKFSRFKITGIYTTIVIVTMALPIIGAQGAELKLLMRFGLYDTLFAPWILSMTFMGIYYLVFLENFRAIPKDYSEAAYVDGAGNFTLFFRLMLPFASKTLATVMLINFIASWNDYQFALLYLPSYPTLAYGLYGFTVGGNNSMAVEINANRVPIHMAACMVLFVPIFLIFCFLQKHLMGNLQLGGLKG